MLKSLRADWPDMRAEADIVDLTQARELLASEQLVPCLEELKTQWLKDIHNVDCMRFCADLTRAGGREELAEHVAKLAENTEKGEKDPQSLFEVGFRLIDE